MKFEHNMPSAVSSSDAKSESFTITCIPSTFPLRWHFFFISNIGTEAAARLGRSSQASVLVWALLLRWLPCFLDWFVIGPRHLRVDPVSRQRELLVLGGLLLSALGTVCLLRASTSMSIITWRDVRFGSPAFIRSSRGFQMVWSESPSSPAALCFSMAALGARQSHDHRFRVTTFPQFASGPA